MNFISIEGWELVWEVMIGVVLLATPFFLAHSLAIVIGKSIKALLEMAVNAVKEFVQENIVVAFLVTTAFLGGTYYLLIQ